VPSLQTGGGEGGAKSYDSEKACSFINHSIPIFVIDTLMDTGTYHCIRQSLNFYVIWFPDLKKMNNEIIFRESEGEIEVRHFDPS
jgi:hypothetical protein